ncbi:unnamed protein product [Mycena citricolor]|uniref:Uncharacterized protein n=1 Tax=Mycena citricolor TaxID=2018698 RepID=A0AAD2JXS7_9AGAR|nr:unnamed protein product [Mycena citricolor]
MECPQIINSEHGSCRREIDDSRAIATSHASGSYTNLGPTTTTGPRKFAPPSALRAPELLGVASRRRQLPHMLERRVIDVCYARRLVCAASALCQERLRVFASGSWRSRSERPEKQRMIIVLTGCAGGSTNPVVPTETNRSARASTISSGGIFAWNQPQGMQDNGCVASYLPSTQSIDSADSIDWEKCTYQPADRTRISSSDINHVRSFVTQSKTKRPGSVAVSRVWGLDPCRCGDRWRTHHAFHSRSTSMIRELEATATRRRGGGGERGIIDDAMHGCARNLSLD